MKNEVRAAVLALLTMCIGGCAGEVSETSLTNTTVNDNGANARVADSRAARAPGTNVNGWNGWGYVVNHYASSAGTSRGHPGTFRTVFAGAHHAIHEFKVRMNPGGPLDATVHWFFASGRSYPVYFITLDATAA